MIAGLCMIALTIPAYRWMDAERQNVGAIPRAIAEQGDLTRGWLNLNLMPPVNRLAATADKLPAMTRDLIDKHASAIEARLNGQLSEALRMADARTGQALEQIAGLRMDLQPTLANTASITAHADEAAAILLRRDALPAQTLGLLAAAKVTAGETALTMRAVAKAAPELASAAVSTGKSVESIAASADKEAKELTRPRSFRQKLILWLELIPRIGLRVL